MYKIIYKNNRTGKYVVEYGFNVRITKRLDTLKDSKAFKTEWVLKLFPTPSNIWKCFTEKCVSEK